MDSDLLKGVGESLGMRSIGGQGVVVGILFVGCKPHNQE
jgi:hypothetical protein